MANKTSITAVPKAIRSQVKALMKQSKSQPSVHGLFVVVTNDKGQLITGGFGNSVLTNSIDRLADDYEFTMKTIGDVAAKLRQQQN